MTILADLIDNQTDPTLAPYAKTGEVTLRSVNKASSQERAGIKYWIFWNIKSWIARPLKGFLYRDLCYGYGEETSLASVVVEELKNRQENHHGGRGLTAGLFKLN